MPPAGVVAQAAGLQLAVEQPTAGSTLRGMVLVAGWALDPSSPRDTGVAPDGVEIWLGPAGTGQLLGRAGYGDPRPDVAAQRGNAAWLLAGFRYFWNSCEAPPGPNVLTVTARSRAAPGRTTIATVPISVESCVLALGEAVTGQILTSGQADAWTFEGTAGERVAITLDGIGGWDTFLELIAPNGAREDMDDDGGPDLNSWLSRLLAQTGTYTVLARPFSTEGCTGDYMVLGWLGPPSRSDPNTAAAALGTTRSFTFRGSLRAFGERQPWTFEGQAGAELILDIPRNVGSALDPFVELLAPDGQLLAQDDDSGGGLNAFLQGVLRQDGTYQLIVESARQDCGGEYELRVENGWGEHSRLRGDLPFGETEAGALSLGVRRDIWNVPTTAGERITLALDTSGPTRLQVASPSSDWEQARASRGRGIGLSFEPSQTGTYQAVVFIDTSRPIDYSLTLERGYGRLISYRGPVALGQPVQGEIRFGEARDLYTFEGREGQQARIALDRPGRSQLDPYLELRDPDGRTIAEDDDSGGELNALIRVALPRTGTYTVVARGVADSAGPYVLTVTLTDGPLAPPAPGGSGGAPPTPGR